MNVAPRHYSKSPKFWRALVDRKNRRIVRLTPEFELRIKLGMGLVCDIVRRSAALASTVFRYSGRTSSPKFSRVFFSRVRFSEKSRLSLVNPPCSSSPRRASPLFPTPQPIGPNAALQQVFQGSAAMGSTARWSTNITRRRSAGQRGRNHPNGERNWGALNTRPKLRPAVARITAPHLSQAGVAHIKS